MKKQTEFSVCKMESFCKKQDTSVKKRKNRNAENFNCCHNPL